MGDTVSTLLFQPPPPTKLKENKIIWLKTSKGKRIPGFYIHFSNIDGEDVSRSLTVKELQSTDASQGITILYSHANAEDLGSIYPWCKFLSKMLRVNLLAYDYTGYGMAYDEGNPSEECCYADIRAAYDFLRHDLDVPAKNIVLYGRSLGSGPSCQLAAGTALSEDPESGGPVGGVILHAPFLSVYRIVIDTGCTVYGDKFPNIDQAPSIKSPTILVHGTADQIVPFNHSERLYEALPKESRARPLYIEGMGHNNVHSVVRPMFVARLNEFLDEHVWPNVNNTRTAEIHHNSGRRQR
ncbi:serine aminopeptidase, S33 [Nitzschia inconspicua]|uniref:Serine aminopeptidase, S33 n=1 Tax=Nitzschia inconspicua TaxID=303405 RepID=A0A9K3PUG4_9STRA|nr:serine aminopeptidase, S33 [Nitzschia inconspicua]